MPGKYKCSNEYIVFKLYAVGTLSRKGERKGS